MPSTLHTGLDALVLVDDTNGVTVIPQLSELRRLNWFDGKLLRADDLRVEQDHMRGLVRRSNRAGGHGVVQGMTCTLGIDGRLHVGPGTAIDPRGRPLLLPVDVPLDVQELIDRTAAASGAGDKVTVAKTLSGIAAAKDAFADCVEPQVGGQAPVGGGRWFVITVGWAEGLCGNEEVFGRLCEDACTTSTDRPWRIDGLVFRARPVRPFTPLQSSSAVALDGRHERSLLASALFADERAGAGSLIFGDGLRAPIWCHGAAPNDPAHDEVALAVIARQAGTTAFLDAWTARRERIEPPPQRYWAGRMSMRPWDVFLAQVLQFQCQLSDLLDDGPGPGGPGPADPCAERQVVLESAIAELEKRPLKRDSDVPQQSDDVLELLKTKMLSLRLASGPGGARRVLVDGGIVELPPAGYLPVALAGPPSVEDQVRDLVGAGVDLTFCTTRQDAVARAFEEAQHLDRISLLRGLDDPKRREEVEIIIPDADVREAVVDGWEGRLRIEDEDPRSLDGAGRVEWRDGLAMRWAGQGQEAAPTPQLTAGAATRIGGSPPPSVWLEATAEHDPFTVMEGEAVTFSASADFMLGSQPSDARRASLHGRFRVRSVELRPGGKLLRGGIDVIAVMRGVNSDGQEEKDSWKLDNADAMLLSRRTDDGGTTALARVVIEQAEILSATLTWHGDADSVELVAFASDRRSRSINATKESDVGASATATATATATTTGLGRELARLTLHREPGAASPGHPVRTTAETALRALQKAFDEPGYAEHTGRRLFPADDGGLRMLATRDWVLFRRRAVLRCGGTAGAPVSTDSFAVYGRLDAERHEPAPVFLGELRFREDSAELAGSADAIAGAWDAVAHGGSLQGAVVVAGSPGGDDLALRRTSRLVTALAGVTAPAEGLSPQVVDAETVDLDARGADGIMLVYARPAAEMEVAVVAVDVQMVSGYRSAMEEQQLTKAMNHAFEVPHLLGTVLFPEDSAVPSSQSKLQAVVEAYGSDFENLGLIRADLFSVEGDPGTGSPNVRFDRVKQIADAIDSSGVSTSIWEVGEGVLQDARSRGIGQNTIVILTPDATVTARVISVRPGMAAREYLNRMDEDNAPAGVDAAMDAEIALGSIGFQRGSAIPLNDDEVHQIPSAYKQSVGDLTVHRIDVISVAEDETGTSEEVDTGRGKVVANAMPGEINQGVQRFVVPADVLSARGVSERVLIVVAPAP